MEMKYYSSRIGVEQTLNFHSSNRLKRKKIHRYFDVCNYKARALRVGLDRLPDFLNNTKSTKSLEPYPEGHKPKKENALV